MDRRDGFGLAEALVGLAVLMLIAGLAIGAGGRTLARWQLEAAARRVWQGLDHGRLAAEQMGRPCGLQLGERGWQAPEASSLPACEGVELALDEGLLPGSVWIEHNLPATVRFSSNGLVLDGGTVRIGREGDALVRCVVVALPLGITRVGRQGSSGCEPDPTL